MQIKKLIKTKEGTFLYEAEISQEEHEVIFDVGLNAMLAAGALPFINTQIDVLPLPQGIQ